MKLLERFKMDFDDMITVLAEVKKTHLEEGESIIVNLEVDSRALFLMNASSIDSLFGKIRDECGEMDCVVQGPGRIELLDRGDAWLVMAENPPYVEGMLAISLGDGYDGWGAVQYTSTDVERAVSFGSEVIGDGRLLSALVSAYHGKFPAIGSVDKREAVAHFCQMPAHAWRRGTAASAVSGYIIDLFYAKGWRLYEALRWDNKGMETIRQGPAKILKIKTPYHIFPTTHDASSPKWVGIEMQKMRETGQQPAFTSRRGRYGMRAVVLDTEGIVFKLDDGCIASIPYTSLEDEINANVSEYDRERIPVGKSMPGDEMGMNIH
jgi:hypothetical protein